MTRMLWAIAFAGLLAGCAGDDETDDKTGATGEETGGDTGKKTDGKDDESGDTGTTPKDATVRVLHLGQGVDAVDIFVDDAAKAAVSKLAFKEGTAALALAPATYDIDVSPTGKGAADSVLDAEVTLEAGKSYAAVALGFGAATKSPDTLRLAAFEEDVAGTPKDMTRLHVVHAAAGVGEVDILAIGGKANTVLIDDFAFAGEDTLDIAPGATQIGIDLDDDLTPELTFSVPDLGAGAYASVYAVNAADEGKTADVSLIAHIAGTADPTEIAPDAE